jgi:monomeric isocitrate dehydrogenase
MPAMIRAGGKMWGADGKQYDAKADARINSRVFIKK